MLCGTLESGQLCRHVALSAPMGKDWSLNFISLQTQFVLPGLASEPIKAIKARTIKIFSNLHRFPPPLSLEGANPRVVS